jgi:hypothetical protein
MNAARFPATLVHVGELKVAIPLHARYYSVWCEFGALPEVVDVSTGETTKAGVGY